MAADSGLSRLQRRLAAIPKAAKEAALPALTKSGDELVALMRQLAREDEGDLKDSIVATPAGRSTPPYSQPGGERVVPENAVMVTAGNEAVRYPHLVEYGHAGGFGGSIVPPYPFFWPAFRLLKRKLANRIRRGVGKAVRETWQK